VSFFLSPQWFEERRVARLEQDAAEERAQRKRRAKALEETKDAARKAEEHFRPLGATFTEWCEAGSSTPDDPVLQAFFRLPDSGILHRVKAEQDSFTVVRV
jgi:hypothetical protein